MKVKRLFLLLLVVSLVGCIEKQGVQQYCVDYGYHFGNLTDCCFYQEIEEIKIEDRHNIRPRYEVTELEYSGKALCINSTYSSYKGCEWACNEEKE